MHQINLLAHNKLPLSSDWAFKTQQHNPDIVIIIVHFTLQYTVYSVNIAAVYLMCTLCTPGARFYKTVPHYLDIPSLC